MMPCRHNVICLGDGSSWLLRMFGNDFFIASGVGLSPLHCGHLWPIVPTPDDR
jgi:hypothetical protein